MDHSIRISIPRTHSESKNSFLSRYYTVYEIRVTISCTCTMTVFRRYKQFRILNDEIQDIIKRGNLALPSFPQKTFFNNSKVISERKGQFEEWLKGICRCYQLMPYLFRFLNIQSDMINQIGFGTNSLPTLDEELIFDFTTRLNTDSRNKIKALDDFEWNFFSKRRSVRSELISFLLKTIIPLCGLNNIGNKAMDIIAKLTSRDRYREYQTVIKELVKIDPEILCEMRLNEHLTKKSHGDCQPQAFHILQILAENFRSNRSETLVISILNHDQEAFDIFHNWENEQFVIKKPVKANTCSTVGMWRSLPSVDMQVSYRLVDKELDICAEFSTDACISRIIEVLTTANERKKWDFRLNEMEEMSWMDGTSGFRLFYMFERTPIEYFTVINTTQTENFGMVEFKPYADGKSDFTLGKSSSCYRFEVVNSNRSAPISPVGSISTNESETNHSSLTDYLSYNDSFKQEIKCTWNAHFCEQTTKLLISDLVEESIVLRNSMTALLKTIENNEDCKQGFLEDYRLADAFDRKKLNRSHRKMSLKR